MFDSVMGSEPLFDNVTGLEELAVPTTVIGNERLDADTLRVKVTPVPLNETAWGLFEALSVMVSAPLRDPVAVGVKLALTVQLELAAKLVPQLLVCAKSPLAWIPLILIAVGPGFDTVTGCETLVLPSACAAKPSVVGVTLRTVLAPVPVSDTVCGLPAALSVMERVPVRVPVPVGVKTTLTVQLALVARLAPQLLV